MNNHKYAKILKDSNSSFYKVIITNTYETGGLFGGIKEHKEEYEIPFVFKTSEIAKDFVSMLPDSIEEFNIKMHRCEHCHLCYASYKTYKLTIGDFTIYVQWDEVEQEEKGFLTDKVFINSKNNVVKNLEYCDAKYNSNYGTRTKRIAEKMKGKHHSEETKQKMSEKHINGKNSKLVLQMDKTYKIIAEFPSVSEVQRQLGISITHISECCNGNRKTCGGYKWQYK